MLAQKIVRFIIYSLLIFTPLARASVQGWAVCVIHIMTLTALTVLLVDKAYRWDWNRIKTPMDMPILALLCLCLVSTFFSKHRFSSFQALMLLFNYVVLFYLIINTIRTRFHFRQIVYIIIGMGTFLSVFGLFKLWGINPFPWWEYPELSRNADRVTASFGNPDHLAGYLEMAIPMILGFFLTGFKDGKRLLVVFFTMLMFTALIFSLSRGAWIGMVSGLLFMVLALLKDEYFKYKKTVLTISALFIVMVLIVLSSTDVVTRIQTFEAKEEMPSLDARVDIWKGIVNMIKAYPLLGSGPGTFAFVFTQYQPPGVNAYYNMGHNDYLHFISETGLLLCGIGMWMMIVFYYRGFKKMKNRSRLVRGITLGGMTGVTAVLVHSIGDFNLHIPANALFFTVLSAMVAAPRLETEKESLFDIADEINKTRIPKFQKGN